jgi:hypothetical protein
MRALIKPWMLSLVIVGSLFPVTAYADQGIMIGDHLIKDESGEGVKYLQNEDKVRIEGETDSDFLIETEKGTQLVPKIVILKTAIEKELSLAVKSDVAHIYKEPSIFSTSIQSVAKGDVLYRIDNQSESSQWIKIVLDNHIEGWINKNHIITNYEVTPITTKAYVKNDYSQNDVNYDRGDEIQLIDYRDGKYVISETDKNVEINKFYVTFEKPIMHETFSRQLSAMNLSEGLSESSQLLEYAFAELGKPYVWGADGPDSFDCSGYTQKMFSKIGIELPRTAAEQATEGLIVSKSNLKPGDLVFFTTYTSGASHVGIYIGDGKMIHAGGDEVHVSSMSLEYWQDRYLYAKRI